MHSLKKASQSHDAKMTSSAASELASASRLIPASKWGEHHLWPPAGGLRHLIFNAASNGFHTVVLRVGRRVLIDENAFFAWVQQQGAAK